MNDSDFEVIFGVLVGIYLQSFSVIVLLWICYMTWMIDMKYLTLIWLLFLSNTLLAETSIWKVSQGDRFLYLGGTIHILSPSDLPFPQAFDQAYREAEVVVLETEMEKLFQPQTQVKLMSGLSYQDGRLLNELISAELYADLNQYLKERGLMPHLFIGMKPAGVMITMLGIEFRRLGISADGADSVYYKRAVKDGKAVIGLETIDEHLGFLVDMGTGNEERFLRQTLDDVKKTESMMREMVRHWKSGNTRELEKDVLDEMREDYPNVYQSLLVERNQRWFPAIESMLRTEEVELILVGAAHLIGPDGILKRLQESGYSVEQM